MSRYHKIFCHDRECFDSVSHLLSVRGASVMAASVGSFSHVVNNPISERLREEVEAFGATIEEV